MKPSYEKALYFSVKSWSKVIYIAVPCLNPVCEITVKLGGDKYSKRYSDKKYRFYFEVVEPS